MTDPNKTSITVILDKSGSMQTARTDTIGGFNSFIEEQKKLSGECEISLIQFSDDSMFTYKSKNIKDLKQGLAEGDYIPKGNTALLDAIGKAIKEKGMELSSRKEEERPGKVMFVIITDGEENASMEYTSEKIKEMVEHQTKVYSWDFTFLGANIDTFATSSSLGIDASKSLSFCSNKSGGAKRAFASVNMYASCARSSDPSKASYTDLDRQSNS